MFIRSTYFFQLLLFSIWNFKPVRFIIITLFLFLLIPYWLYLLPNKVLLFLGYSSKIEILEQNHFFYTKFHAQLLYNNQILLFNFINTLLL